MKFVITCVSCLMAGALMAFCLTQTVERDPQQLVCSTGVTSKAIKIAEGTISMAGDRRYKVVYKDTPTQWIQVGMMDECVIRNIPETTPPSPQPEKKALDISG